MKKILISFLVTSLMFSQSPRELEIWSKNSTIKSFEMFREILSIPNDANQLDDIELNVKWCEKNFIERGFCKSPGNPPAAQTTTSFSFE
ncbi:MAG: hypothetical protein CBD95_003825, partial [Flavobacteriales bacterium TMED235]